MIGATAKAEQFQARMGSEATKGSRKGFSLLGGGESPLAHLTAEQQRASLVAVYKSLSEEAVRLKASNAPAHIRIKLGKQIAEIGAAIHALRPARKSATGLSELFIDVCRDQMTKPQFNAIMEEANRRQRAALAKKPCEVTA